MRTKSCSERRRERGVTILIVVVAMIAMLAMLALAVDIVSLYVAEGDAQRAADAAALAGAKVFVSSGFTSWQLGDPTSGVAQNLVCNGSSGLADLQAQALANANPVGGSPATSVTTSCTWATSNPQITVTVQRTGLPSFFARIWGSRIISVSRSAKAEAYNPSGQSVPTQVHSVKPWLIPNGNFYFDTTTYNMFNNGSAFIGQPPATFTLNTTLTAPPPAPTPTAVQFYAIDIPISPPTPICPSTSAVSCSNLSSVGTTRGDYEQNIACSGMYSVNSTDQIGPASPITMIDPVKGQIKNGQATINATQCLIHADNPVNNAGQDAFNYATGIGTPVTISGGYNNPNPALQNALSISRSDSVVTVPVYDDKGVAPCTGNPPVCNQQLQIIGFLQLGIQYVDNVPPPVTIHAVILNAAGSNPANSGTTPLPAGWLDSAGFRHVNEAAPVPVRLIQ